MIFSTVRTWLTVAVASVVGALWIAVRVLASKNSKLKVRAEVGEANAKFAKTVLKEDKAADEQADVRLVDAKKELEGTGGSGTFRDPNKLFKRSDNK
jgi:hypothetical protein